MSSNRRGVLLVLALFLSGCNQAAVRQADIIDIDSIRSEEANYQLYECVPMSLERTASEQASISYPVHTPLFFRESGGRLKGIYVANGQSVQKGEVLAEILFDDGTLSSEIRERELQYDNDSANIALEQERRMAEINDMHRQKAKSQGRMQIENGDEARLADSEARIWDLRIKRAESDYYFYTYDSQRRLSEQREELDELREKLQGEAIIAPFDGVVDGISAYPAGKMIEQWEWIMGIYDPAIYELTFQGDAASFRYNMEIDIEVPRAGTFKGLIISDPAVLDTGEGQLQYHAVFIEESPDFNEVKSKIISVKGKAFTLEGIIAIPNKGLRNEDAKKYVFIIEDNIVKKRYVQQGLYTPDATQILDGVELGDMIVLN